MERISQRERELLGYAPGSSDGVAVDDFRDVFGGPPRRFSSPANDPRRPRRESLDSFSPRERRSGSRLLEKPVFGGGSGSPASSAPRRSHLGGDFYSDIFPGSDSSSSSPVKLDRDPLSSSPSPRISSPRRESLSGGAALPAQLSVSMKLAKAADYPTPNSPAQRAPYNKDLGSSDWLGFPHSPIATSRVVSENYDLNIDGQAFYRQSPLSRQASSGLEAYLEATDSLSIGMEVRSKTVKTSLDAFVGSGRMHFSFYKWAGKGVTLIMPSHAKEKSVSRLARLPEVVVQAIELPLYNDDIPTATTPSRKSPTESKSSTLVKDIFTDKNGHPVSTTAEKRLTDGLESKSPHSNVTADSDTYNKNSRRAQVTMSDKQKLETKNLHQLFNDGFDKEGNGDTVEQSEENKSFFKSRRNVHEGVNAKEQEGRESSMKHVEVASPIMQDTQVPLEEKMLGNRVNSVKGKVKEFIKIFNHELSPKRKGTFESQTRRSRGKDEMDVKIKDKVSTPATKMTVETKATKGSNNKPLLDTPTGITPISVAKKPYSMDFDIHMLNEPSAERNATSETFFGSTPKVIEASISDIEESHSDELDGCFVEQLSEDPSDKLQTDSPPDQIKTSDAKIREWSKGKEGNIRSLLSTLQYVLWPESGWKPIPLVDIIESTSVKRAYQKALLCLHPDKLQQKGAATHQKYIAEKVFDILQESWDHFNSITSF